MKAKSKNKKEILVFSTKELEELILLVFFAFIFSLYFSVSYLDYFGINFTTSFLFVTFMLIHGLLLGLLLEIYSYIKKEKGKDLVVTVV